MDEKLSPIKKRGFYTGWNWISFSYNLYNTKHLNFWDNSEDHLIFTIKKVDKSKTLQNFQTLEKLKFRIKNIIQPKNAKKI